MDGGRNKIYWVDKNYWCLWCQHLRQCWCRWSGCKRRDKGRSRSRTSALNMRQDVFLQHPTLFPRSPHIPQTDSVLLGNPTDSRGCQHLHIPLGRLLGNHLLSLSNLQSLFLEYLIPGVSICPRNLIFSNLLFKRDLFRTSEQSVKLGTF